MSRLQSRALPVLAVLLAGGAAPRLAPQRAFTYEVRDLLTAHSGKTGHERIDDIATFLLTNASPDTWGRRGRASLVMAGTTLEVTTTEAGHAEVRELLTQLRRLADVNVRFTCTLAELPAADFDRELAPSLKDDLLVPVPEVAIPRLQGVLTTRRTVTVAAPRGKEVEALSARAATTYDKAPRDVPWDGETVGTVVTGLVVRVSGKVTPDRRKVAVRLTQVTDRIVRWDRKTVFDRAGRDADIRVPRVAQSTLAGDRMVHDGVTLAMAVHGPAPRAGVRQVLLVRPVIVIEEEERAIRGN